MPVNAKPDAIDLLKAEHQEAKALFDIYQALCDDEASGMERQAVAQEICVALTVHCQLEEELFYPAVARAIGQDALMDEAEVEHAVAKGLIAQIMAMKATDALYDARVRVLGESVRHHVREEHTRMFPLVRKADVDLLALGARMNKRKDQLLAQLEARAGREDESADPVGPVQHRTVNGAQPGKGA